MWLSGEWDKHVRHWVSYSATWWSHYLRLSAHFSTCAFSLGVKWSYVPCSEVSVGFLLPAVPVSSLLAAMMDKKVLPWIEDQPALVEQNQYAGSNKQAIISIRSGALRTVWVYEIHFNAVFLMLYLWNNKDLSPSAQLPPERSYTLGDKNHKPRPLVPNGQGHAHG